VDIEYFEQLWARKENKYSSFKEGDSKAWDNRVEEFTTDKSDERIELVARFLREKHLLQETSTVLDIGCGPGRFALEFARTARQVIGIDISPKMLDAAEKNLQSARLDNVQFKNLDWQEADLQTLGWLHKFSLVTAFMSPAVNNRSMLEKMTQASTDYCLLCHFLQRESSIADELKKRILGDYPKDKYGNKGLYCSFNILWLSNYYPELICFDTFREVTRSLPEAIRYYSKKLEHKVTLTPAQKEFIADYLEDKAENGQVTEVIKGKIGCIYWKKRE